jgi:hypothetical protein
VLATVYAEQHPPNRRRLTIQPVVLSKVREDGVVDLICPECKKASQFNWHTYRAKVTATTER